MSINHRDGDNSAKQNKKSTIEIKDKRQNKKVDLLSHVSNQ